MHWLEKVFIGIGFAIIIFQLAILITQGFLILVMGSVFGNKALQILYDLIWRQ